MNTHPIGHAGRERCEQDRRLRAVIERSAVFPTELAHANTQLRKELIHALSTEATLLGTLVHRDGMIARLEKARKADLAESSAKDLAIEQLTQRMQQQIIATANIEKRLIALRDSPFGRLQRAYWRAMRKLKGE